MIFFGHTAVGVAIGVGVLEYTELDAPTACLLALAAGIISHYITDFIPHGHYEFDAQNLSLRMKRNLALDVAITLPLASILFIRAEKPASIIVVGAAVFGALIPDLITAFFKLSAFSRNKLLAAEEKFHMGVHWHSGRENSHRDGARRLGISDVWQVLVYMGSLFVLLHGQF